MGERLRLLAVLAHPDDECFAVGGALARYASEGVGVHLLTATSGQNGRYFPDRERPSDEEVGRTRERELLRAAEELGVEDVHLLRYRDGALSRVDPAEAAARVAEQVRRVRPHVVITFDPFGASGHPDHVTICRLTTSALVAAAAPSGAGAGPHRVPKLYYAVLDEPRWSAVARAFPHMADRFEGRDRSVVLWPEWAVTTRVDATAHAGSVRRAIACHETQASLFRGLDDLSDERNAELWGRQPFYRAVSLLEHAHEGTEHDLFAGLR